MDRELWVHWQQWCAVTIYINIIKVNNVFNILLKLLKY